MTIDLFSASGEKKGTIPLPDSLFGGKVNAGLMHLALIMQQSNRRHPIAHVKTRGEVRGSTRKLFAQKGTGRARRGPIRSPLLRGGGRAFGPRNERNFRKEMPKKARRAALLSSLAFAQTMKKILALEGYEGDHKTKTLVTLLSKLPVSAGRKITIVLPKHMQNLERGARNIPGVKTLLAPYLNTEDIVSSHHIIFLVDALKVAEEMFGKSLKTSTTTKAPKKSAKSTAAAEGRASTSR